MCLCSTLEIVPDVILEDVLGNLVFGESLHEDVLLHAVGAELVQRLDASCVREDELSLVRNVGNVRGHGVAGRGGLSGLALSQVVDVELVLHADHVDATPQGSQRVQRRLTNVVNRNL